MPPARIVLYAATAAVAVLTVRSAILGPPPLWAAVLALVAYGALVVVGVVILRLRVFADAIVRGPDGARGVVLTFDDGPDPRTTPAVLDALDAARAKATFFLIARKARQYPDLVRRIVARGHAVGLHGYEHDRLFSFRSETRVRADLETGMKVLEDLTGARPALFRPPIGHTNPRIVRVAEALDLTIVGWSASGRDGLRGADAARVAARIGRGLRDGAIVLMHDAAERGDFEPAGPKALVSVLELARARSLAIVPLQPWVDAAQDT